MIKKIFRKILRTIKSKPGYYNVLDDLKNYTLGNIEALKLHQALALKISEDNIQGDIVECGVYNGGSAAAMASAANMDQRKIWLYDSFEGMPSISDIDGKDAKKYEGMCVGEIDKVKSVMAFIKLIETKYIIKKGWFKQTFKEKGPEKIALLHIDSDWYESVKICLEHFYDRVQEGGIILLDDFGHWEGCRNAFYDFIQQRNIKPLVERRGHTQMFWIKGKEHNRDNSGRKMFFE
jgi:O-methyltransferase